jgi:hypothetical protein
MGRSAKVNRYSFYERANVDAAAPTNGSTWTHLPIIGTPRIKKDQQRAEDQIANPYGTRSADRATVQASSFAFQVPFFTGTAGTNDTDPTSCYLQKLLENYHGATAVSAFTGTTVDAASAGTTLNVVAGTNIGVGRCLQIGSEFRFVVAKPSAHVCTIDSALTTSSNYDVGTIVYGGFVFTPTLGHYAPVIDINDELADHSDMLLKGRVNSLKLDGLAAKAGLKWDVGIAGDGFSAGGGVTPSSFTYNAFTGAHIVAQSGRASIGGTALAVTTGSVDFGIEHVERETATTAGAINGRDNWEAVSVTPKMSLGCYHSTANWTAYTGRTEQVVTLVHSVGTTNAAKSRGFVGIIFFNAQMTTDDDAPNSQVGQKLDITGNTPTSTQITAGITFPYALTIGGGI